MTSEITGHNGMKSQQCYVESHRSDRGVNVLLSGGNMKTNRAAYKPAAGRQSRWGEYPQIGRAHV